MKKYIFSLFVILSVLSNTYAQTAGNPVPHTAPRDQGYVGFCWSYTLMGLMEGEALKSGKNITLSPEYVGFYHMYDGLLKSLPTIKFFARKKEPKSWFDKNAWELARKEIAKVVLQTLQQTPSEGSPGMAAPFQYAAQYGVVPESIFVTKITKDKANLEGRVLNMFIEKFKLKSTVEDYQAHNEKLFADFAAAFGATPPKPTDTFTYEGNNYTPITFMKTYLNFDPTAYKEVVVNRSNQSTILPKIQKSLADGFAVPMGFIIFKDSFELAKTSGTFDSATCANQTCTQIAGGHAVLIVNSSASGVIIKNSWGQTGQNVMGEQSQDTSTLGYYTVTSSYLDNPFRLTKDNKPMLDDNAQGYSIVLRQPYL